MLDEILYSLFKNKKTALLFDDIKLLQNILMLLPKSIRLIAFSTFVVDPTKQPKYRFILSPKLNKSKIQNSFKLISPKKVKIFSDKTSFKQCISYYAELIKANKFKELQEIRREFEDIPKSHIENKLILTCNYSQFKLATDETKQSQYAENILYVIKQFEQNTFSNYFDKIKDSLDQYGELETKH